MNNASSSRRRTARLALPALLLIGILPMAAQATQIQLTGIVNNTFSFGPNPFVKGQSLSGLFNVNLEPDNSFNQADLTSFSLTVGPAVFNLAPSQFGSFSGAINDAGMLTSLSLVSPFVQPDGVNGQYALGFNGVNQPFSVTGAGGSITTGSFSGQALPDAVNDVPEPSSVGLLGLALAMLLGAGLYRRREDTARVAAV